MDWKLDLYTKIAPALAPHAIVASNTSGLSITKLSEVLPSRSAALLRHPLLQPAALHGAGGADQHPGHAARGAGPAGSLRHHRAGQGRGARQGQPNFIANRVGIAGMLATIHEARTFGLTYDVVDDLTGKKMGRASSGTFRTADVVGLDTMAHVIKTLQDNLADDPFYAQLRHAARAGRADREGRAGPEDRRRLLQEGGQGHPAPGPGQG
jgi:3-hydroxyacyl-CoA dehydrogenase